MATTPTLTNIRVRNSTNSSGLTKGMGTTVNSRGGAMTSSGRSMAKSGKGKSSASKRKKKR